MIFPRRTLAGRFAASVLLVFACSTLARRPETVVDLSALRDKEQLVLTVGNRLAIASADLCTKRAPALGFAVHDLSQYAPAYVEAARPMFARPDLPAILAVATGGEAARVGLRPGDAVAAIDGKPVPPADIDGLARVEAVIAASERDAANGRLSLTIVRQGRSSVLELALPEACAVRFQVQPGSELNARANGWLIELSTRLIDFLRGPDELAAVLAHELAHNILRHREHLKGGSIASSRAAELEADRLSVRLMHRAGFRAAAAAEFWRRMRERGGLGPSGLGRHPSDGERIKAVESELQRLKAGM